MRHFLLLSAFLIFGTASTAQNVFETPKLIAESNSKDLTQIVDLDFRINSDNSVQFFVADVFQASILVMESEENKIVLKNRIGREGLGPGEFIELTNLELINKNELMVYDRSAARITIINPNKFDEFKNIKIAKPRTTHYPMYFIAADSSTFYARGDQYFSDDYDPTRARYSILQKYNVEGELESDSVFVVPADEAFVFKKGRMMSVNPNPVWGKKSIIKFYDDRIYYAWGGDAKIEILNKDGEKIKSINLKLPRVKITDDDRKRTIARESKMSDIRKKVLRSSVNEAMSVDYWPAIYDFHVDDAGNFWIALPSHIEDDERIWQVWNKEGKMIKETKLPSDFTVYQIKQNYIAGELFDFKRFRSKVQLYKVEL